MAKLQITKVAPEDYDRIHAVRPLLKIMKIVGVWQWLTPGSQDLSPSLDATIRVLQLLHRFIMHIPIGFTFVTLMWVEALRAPDVGKAGDVLYMALAETVMIVKVLNIWHFSERAAAFMYEVDRNPEYALRTSEEIKFWNNAQRRYRIITYLFFAGSILTGIFQFMAVLFMKDYQLPYGFWIPFEWRTIPRNYWIAYFYNMLSISVTLVSNVSLDVVGCYMMSHVASLYKIVSFRLHKLKSAKEDNDITRKLLDLIRLHTSIRRKCKECETLTSNYTFAQITLSSVILCFCAYRIIQMDITEAFGEFIAMSYFLSVMVLEIFLPCYFANEISVNSAELATAIYSCGWQDFPLKTQKLVFIYMELLKQPDRVMAGGYFEVSLPIFTNVMNNAYKGFALLMNIAK